MMRGFALGSEPCVAACLTPFPSPLRARPCIHCVPLCARAAMGGAGGEVEEGKEAPVAPAIVPGADTLPDWVIRPPHAPDGGAGSHDGKLTPLCRGPHEGGRNCWSEVDAKNFSLRSAGYLVDKVKTPSLDAAFRSVGVHAFKTSKPVRRGGEVIPELREFLAAHPAHHFLVVGWMLPGTPSHTVLQTYVRHAGPDEVLDPLYQVRRGMCGVR